MIEHSDFKFQISDKIGDMILVARADTISEVTSEIKTLKENLGSGVTPPPAPPPVAVGTASPEHKCSIHDLPMVYKEGVSAKTGKPWKGFFCTVPNCQADPLWIK